MARKLLILTFGAVLLVCLCGRVRASLQNYENDANLAKAMEYDLEQNHGDYDKGDRALAEKYYLAYLEDAKDSFQKARVYVQLGVMYTTSINRKKGDKPDLEKARAYFRKALEIEPERFDIATIRARTMLAPIEKSRLTRIRADMDVYEWLRSMDEEKIKRLWLPTRPDNTSPSPSQLTKTANVRESVESNYEYNIISSLSSPFERLDPQVERDLLLEMSSRFKGSKLAAFAEGKLAEDFIPTAEPNEPALIEVPPQIPLTPQTPEPNTAVVEQVEQEQAITSQASNSGRHLWRWLLSAAVVISASVLLLRKNLKSN